MRAWKAVVVVNALLVLVGVGSFTAWRRAQTASAAAAQMITWGGPEREWHGIHGIVRAVLPQPDLEGKRIALLASLIGGAP